MFISHTKKIWAYPYHPWGCRKCPFTDKSRPYIQWTLADLFTDVIQNFLHSEKVNKSQTRIKSICHRFFTLSEPAVILKWRCKDSNKFWYMQIFLLFWWKKLKIFITNASFNQYVIARRIGFLCVRSGDSSHSRGALIPQKTNPIVFFGAPRPLHARFSCLTSRRGTRYYIFFICYLVISYLRLFVR